MQTIPKDTLTAAQRTIFFLAANDPADTPHTGAFATTELQVSKAGAAETNSAGVATHIANGLYKYESAAAEVDTFGPMSLRLNKTGVYGDVYVVQVVAADMYDVASMGLTRLDTTISSRLATASYQDIAAMLDAADTIETGLTLRNALRLIAAYAAGDVTGGGSGTELFTAAVDTAQTRFTSTPTSAGSRTVVVDLT